LGAVFVFEYVLRIHKLGPSTKRSQSRKRLAENEKIMQKITTIYLANTYGKGCPSNTSGRQSGIGLTKKEAITNCRPWANQAPFFRPVAKEVLLVDGSDQNAELVYALLPESALYDYKNERDSEGIITETKLVAKCPALIKSLDCKNWSEALRLASDLKIV
jgi:hypothetical protein